MDDFNTIQKIPFSLPYININSKDLIYAFSKLIYETLEDDTKNKMKFNPESPLFRFNEEYYFLKKPESFSKEKKQLLKKNPNQEQIFEFLEAFCRMALISENELICAFIYILRILNNEDYPILATTWRPLLVIALHLAKKVLNDHRFNFNRESWEIYPFVTLKEFYELEKCFLVALDFNVRVSNKAYAKTYLEFLSFVFEKKGKKRSRSL